MDDNLVSVAMQIILHAGNARELTQGALTAIEAADPVRAGELLDEAKSELAQAHRAQTSTMQAESRGERVELTVLFVHAQDTLMTVKSEWTIAKQLTAIVATIDKRLAALERKS